MGAKGSKPVTSEEFRKRISTAVRSAQEKGDFCDLVIRSSERHEFKAHKFVMFSAFPNLRLRISRNDALDTAFSDEVIKGLIKYAYSGTLTLNRHFLGVLSVLLEMVPTQTVRDFISVEVRDHVKGILDDRDDVVKLPAPEMAAAVFVAKIHDIKVSDKLVVWQKQHEKAGGGDSEFLKLMKYCLKSKKGDPLKPYGDLLCDES